MAEYALDEVDYEEWEADDLDVSAPEADMLPSEAALPEPQAAVGPRSSSGAKEAPPAPAASSPPETASVVTKAQATPAVVDKPESQTATTSQAEASAASASGRLPIPAPASKQRARPPCADGRPHSNRRGGQGQQLGQGAPSARRHSPVIFPPPGLQSHPQQQHHHHQQQQQQQQQRGPPMPNGMPPMFPPIGRLPLHPGAMLLEPGPSHGLSLLRPQLRMPQHPEGFGGQVQRPSLPMPPRSQQRARPGDSAAEAANKDLRGVFARLSKAPGRGTNDMSPDWQPRQASPERHRRIPGEPYLMDEDGPPSEPGFVKQLPMRPAQTGSLPPGSAGHAQQRNSGNHLPPNDRPPVPGPGEMWRPGSVPHGHPKPSSAAAGDMEKQKKLEAIKLQIERQRLENQMISSADKMRAQQQTDYHEQSMADLLRIMQLKEQALKARQAAAAEAKAAAAAAAAAAEAPPQQPAPQQPVRQRSTSAPVPAAQEEEDSSPPVPKRGRSGSQPVLEAASPAGPKRQRHSPAQAREPATVVTDLRELLSSRRSKASGRTANDDEQLDSPPRARQSLRSSGSRCRS